MSISPQAIPTPRHGLFGAAYLNATDYSRIRYVRHLADRSDRDRAPSFEEFVAAEAKQAAEARRA